MKKQQIFLLHYAGGNCYSFRFIEPYLEDMELITLELPGRGKRVFESLLKNFDEAAWDIARQIARYPPTPGFLIYGHSMGALLGLKVTGILENMNLKPAYLIVSGNPGPDIKERTQRYLLGREDFRTELERLGGMPTDFCNNDELFDFFEPILRADFELAETGSDIPFSPVRAPIYAIIGKDDEFSENIQNWKDFTSSYFNGEIIEGGHFFIYKWAGRIAEIIKYCCENSTVD